MRLQQFIILLIRNYRVPVYRRRERTHDGQDQVNESHNREYLVHCIRQRLSVRLRVDLHLEEEEEIHEHKQQEEHDAEHFSVLHREDYRGVLRELLTESHFMFEILAVPQQQLQSVLKQTQGSVRGENCPSPTLSAKSTALLMRFRLMLCVR